MEENGKINEVEDDNEPVLCKGFPIEEKYEDYAGIKRIFTITCHTIDGIFICNAKEKGEEYEGYQFSTFSETRAWSAAGEMRSKIRKMLATRHIITEKDGRISMLHDTIRGRIGYHPLKGMSLIVDGQTISFKDLYGIFSVHEGWQFKLEIAALQVIFSKINEINQ